VVSSHLGTVNPLTSPSIVTDSIRRHASAATREDTVTAKQTLV
jgi:hypothetical protein